MIFIVQLQQKSLKLTFCRQQKRQSKFSENVSDIMRKSSIFAPERHQSNYIFGETRRKVFVKLCLLTSASNINRLRSRQNALEMPLNNGNFHFSIVSMTRDVWKSRRKGKKRREKLIDVWIFYECVNVKALFPETLRQIYFVFFSSHKDSFLLEK